DALKYADRAIEIKPNETIGYLLRSRIHMAQEKLDDALDDLNQVIKIAPRDLNALLTRARLYQAQEKLDDALQDVQRALQLRPGLPQAVLMRSLLNIARQDFDAAIDDLKDLLRANPDNLALKLQLAGIYVANEEHQHAIDLYADVLKTDEQNLTALRGQGDALLGVGKHAEAIKNYELAMKVEATDQGVLNNLAWVLATSPVDDLRDGKRAIELATKACEVTEYKQAHIISTLAAAYAEAGDFEAAKRWSQKAVEMGEGPVKQHLMDELSHYEEGKPFREMQTPAEPKDQPSPDDLQVNEATDDAADGPTDATDPAETDPAEAGPATVETETTPQPS
ncbi:MAG: tetratricopeptide repeat protein, partial [Planctomycetales bacterium]|nr:tetratricopeptide repeat protein [Planctomycetales bacterium]